MRVSLEDIANAFRQLVSVDGSREDVATWAARVREAQDRSELEYDPPAEERRLWDAIVYLEGVDLKTGPTTYLHNEEDFEAFWSSWRASS